jgi:hypothetical protein
LKSQQPSLNQSTNTTSGSVSSSNAIYQKLWDLASAYLKLSVLNELVQTFRASGRILEPIMKVLILMSRYIEKDDQQALQRENDEGMGKDLTSVLLKVI